MTHLSEISLLLFKKRYTQITPEQQEKCRLIKKDLDELKK